MRSFSIKLAGVPIAVESLYDDVFFLCKDYLTEETPAFSVRIAPEDILQEQKKSDREADYEGRPRTIFSAGYLETLAVYRKIVVQLLQYDVLLMHGSAVGVGEDAFLFTAPSGTGKTTHTRLWLREIPGAFVINGDKPLIRVEKDHCEIYGTPWSGKEGMNRNTSARLKAICVLERGKSNAIHRESFSAVLPIILQQSYRPREESAMSKTLALIRDMSKQVTFYRLSCNMDPEAAQISFRGMNP